MKTPHLDALANESLTFDAAYVAVAWCCPSRTALLTSRRPDVSKVWSVVSNLTNHWRQVKNGGNFSSFPQTFKQNGYLTIGMGA